MIAASPNCRSRSSSSVFLPSNFANALARFVAVTVLPVPPFGEKTVRIFPWRPPPPLPAPASRPREWVDLRIAKTTFSTSCGSSRTSATSASSACSSMTGDPPEATIRTGARV